MRRETTQEEGAMLLGETKARRRPLMRITDLGLEERSRKPHRKRQPTRRQELALAVPRFSELPPPTPMGWTGTARGQSPGT